MIIIRLARYGRKKRPSYKIVVCDRRRSCQGKFIKQIGFFNSFNISLNREYFLNINIQSLEYWIKKGAYVTSKIYFLLKTYYPLSDFKKLNVID